MHDSEKKEDFVHLHTHSDLSQLDGCGKISDYVDAAHKRGNPAISFTDHGTMRGYMTQYEECKRAGIKPIYGVEFYVSRNMYRKGITAEEKTELSKGRTKAQAKEVIAQYEINEGIRKRWHLTVHAETEAGLKNLFRLTSKAFIEGFYYKPRIDIETLCEHSEGLIVSSGCVGSPVNSNWFEGNRRYAVEVSDKLHEVFQDRYMIEIQPHDIAEQLEANKLAVKLRKRYGGKSRLVATQDAHYINKSDAVHHDVLLCIGTGSYLSDPKRMKFDGDEFHMRTRREMIRAFMKWHSGLTKGQIKEALDTTMLFHERCNVKLNIDYHAALLPDPGIPPEYVDDFSYLKDLCIQGWSWREIPARALAYSVKHGVPYEEALSLYSKRLKHELGAIKKQRFVPYFILIHDLYRWARGENIMVGPGRGSVAGCLIGYLIGLTSVDPIDHGLIFERFINPNRIDMPDIDMDFEDRRRQEVFAYLRRKYGEDKVCQIATVGKLSGKQCLKDVSRVLQVPYAEVNQVTNSIIERSSGDERASQTIEDSFKEFEICRDFDKRYPKVLYHSKRLEGMAKNLGIHAAGAVASPVPLTDIIPLEVRKHNGKDVIVSAVDMYGVAASGLVKLDVLGLRTLTVLKEATEAIEERHGRKIDLESAEVDLSDPKVLKGFTDHDYGGVFQYDTPSADKVCSGVKFSSFEDIAAMTALNRPGTSRSGLASRYVDRKKNPEKAKKHDFHPAVSEITKDTLGIIVYQEHVIKIFTDIAGFAPATADSLRKTIAKKIGDETMGKERANFVAGAVEKTGMDEKTAHKIMDAITFFGCVPWWTQIATPFGPRAIDSLSDGDEIYSVEECGKVVINTIKTVTSTGPKDLYRITASGFMVDSSNDHYWECMEGGYKKASELCEGEFISYVMGHGFKSSEKEKLLLEEGLRKGSVLPRIVQPSLSETVQKEADRKGQPCEQCAQQVARSTGQGLEKGQKQEYASRDSSARESYDGRVESGLDRLELFRIQNNERYAAGKDKGLPKVRLPSGRGKRCPECESFARPPQEQKQKGQFGGQLGSSLSILSQQGALGGKALWWIRVDEIRQIADRSTHRSGCPARDIECYDIEVDSSPCNYVANGIICHNSYGFNKSHATAYGMIAFWCMFLKTYYPLEFYWSLLKNEPDRVRIQQLAKHAKKKGISFLSPSVNTSKAHFAIDDSRGAIRGSLVDIKGVGTAAAKAIMATQPYTDFFDFLDRVDKRKVHKGVVASLVRAGALDDLVPNPRWLIENMEAFWKQVAKKSEEAQKEARRMIEASKDEKSWDAEEKQLIASKVNPLAFGKHPMDTYKDFLNKNVKIKIADMSAGDFYERNDGRIVLVGGTIVEVKLNQIGDFHTGRLPTEEERERMFWGKRYANVNIEDIGGVQNRIKFDWDVYPGMRPVIELGLGAPVLVMASVNAKFENMRAFFAVDLEGMRKKLISGKPLGMWESIVTGNHPVKHIKAKSDAVKRAMWTNKYYRMSPKGGPFWGVVTNIRLKYDKRGQLMAFFGLIGGNGFMIDVICFASQWEFVKTVISVEQVLKIEIGRSRERGRGVSHIFNGGLVKSFKSVCEKEKEDE